MHEVQLRPQFRRSQECRRSRSRGTQRSQQGHQRAQALSLAYQMVPGGGGRDHQRRSGLRQSSQSSSHQHVRGQARCSPQRRFAVWTPHGSVGDRRFRREDRGRVDFETSEARMSRHTRGSRHQSRRRQRKSFQVGAGSPQRWEIFQGPEVEGLRTALKRAQKEQEVPVEVQIREREAFVERARKRIAKIDAGRASQEEIDRS